MAVMLPRLLGAVIGLAVAGMVTVAQGATYVWVPFAGYGGVGYFELTPTGAGATDTDFDSAILNDFSFIFDNGAPEIELSDITPLYPGPIAVDGQLLEFNYFGGSASVSDAIFRFAGGSADYNYRNQSSVLYPLETNSGNWYLNGQAPGNGDAAIPLPAAFPLFATALAGMGLLGWRRKLKAAA